MYICRGHGHVKLLGLHEVLVVDMKATCIGGEFGGALREVVLVLCLTGLGVGGGGRSNLSLH